MTDWKHAVVRVWDGDKQTGEYLGSAFFITPKCLMTAKHVVESATTSIILGRPETVGLQTIKSEDVIKHRACKVNCVTVQFELILKS